MTGPLAAAQGDDALALARSLSKRVGADREPGDEKAFADLLLEQLRQDRLISAALGPSFGGRSLGVDDVARITCELARQSGSLGLIYAMHMSQAFTLAVHAPSTRYFDELQHRLVKEEALIASGTSEKGVDGDVFGSLCTVESAPNGALMVNKESPNISYLDHAKLILVTAMRPSDKGPKVQVLVAAERERTELRPGRSAGFLGMRGILNAPYSMTACFDQEAIFPEPYSVIASGTMTPVIHVLWASLWSGIAANVLDKARSFLTDCPASDPMVAAVNEFEFSRLVDMRYRMNSLIRDALAERAQISKAGAQSIALAPTARIKRLKVSCSDLLQRICQGSLGLIGLRAYAESGPYSLSEPLRDALSASVMISNYRLTAANAKIERFVDEAL